MKRSARGEGSRSVAIIGMACRFPGASSPEQLWELLRHGVDVTSETPVERYDVDALYAPEPKPGTVASRRAGYVADAAEFDAEFFEMSATEATDLDPQQRLLLMAAWEALEDAGQCPDALAGSRTGVFVGCTRGDHLEMQFRQGLGAVTASMYHNFRPLLPARLSYFFDIRGPSMLLDTACSSSLVAVHTAVQSLRAGETPLAIAAGVNLALRPDENVMMSQAGTLARDGRVKFGDAGADGYVPSDGVGVVVLKRLDDALADGDRIRAVIHGSAVSNDGRSSGSLLNPSREGQVELLRWAYQDAGVSPADIDFVEAHGAGSPTLDPAEFGALGEVLGEGRPADRPFLVGSVKTNIGHSEAAGGMAGLIKAVLSLEHHQVPPTLHLDTPSPLIDWDQLPLRVPTTPQALPNRGRPALAGVSGQGVSSLNAHLVLGQGEHHAARHTPVDWQAGDGAAYVLPLSARTPQALRDLARAYATYLAPQGPGAAYALRDICYSAAVRRQHHPHRMAVVATSHAGMVSALGGSDQRQPAHPAMADMIDRYRAGQEVDWRPAFPSGGRYVPVPTYPWQTRRYWPGEPVVTEHATEDLASRVLREHARTAYSDDSLLAEIGIDSLAMLRIVVDLSRETGQEVDPEELASLRTVGALREWLHSLEAHAV